MAATRAAARSPRRLHGDAGASALELTLVAPVLLLFLFSSIQAGLWFYGRAVAEQAAREGVSRLRLAQSDAVADAARAQVQDAVVAYATAVGRETLLSPTASTTYDEQAGKVSVTVRGTVITLVPGLDLPVTQRVFGEIERFEGDER